MHSVNYDYMMLPSDQLDKQVFHLENLIRLRMLTLDFDICFPRNHAGIHNE